MEEEHSALDELKTRNPQDIDHGSRLEARSAFCHSLTYVLVPT